MRQISPFGAKRAVRKRVFTIPGAERKHLECSLLVLLQHRNCPNFSAQVTMKICCTRLHVCGLCVSQLHYSRQNTVGRAAGVSVANWDRSQADKFKMESVTSHFWINK
jgi:hypothetical protein